MVEQSKINTVEANLSVFVSALIDFIGAMDFPGIKSTTCSPEKIEERKKMWQEKVFSSFNIDAASTIDNITIPVQRTIYDFLIEAMKGDSTAIDFLHFLNCLFEDLADKLSDDEKLFVRTNVKETYVGYTQSRLNYLGEIAILNNLIKLIRCYIHA